jgi:hypothetical protein
MGDKDNERLSVAVVRWVACEMVAIEGKGRAVKLAECDRQFGNLGGQLGGASGLVRSAETLGFWF